MTEVPFGEWLKRQRMGKGLTRDQLAHQIGCAAITLRKIEAEERRPSAQIVERLTEIFDIPPNEKTAFISFARGDWTKAPGEQRGETPWRDSTQSPRTNLRAPLTSFIGRNKEVADVREYVSNPNTRLITLLGPPGIGKTRLSLAVGRASLAEFTGGVFFVELAPLEDQNLVALTIAQTLGFVETPDRSSSQQLKDEIGDKHILVILDNVEHLLDTTAILASDLLSACPRLKILTTSREAIRSPGEWLYPVPALNIPTPTELQSIDIDGLSHFSAIKLFAERGRAARPDFSLNADNVSAVTAICSQLDGLPLAIELIAARVRWMSAQALLSQLTDQFVLSADGMRAVPTRQKKLLNAIGWSYNSLPEQEQALFRRLAVFVGGWTLEEAQAICSGDGLETDDIPVLLTHLLEKSLMFLQEHAGPTRYQMLVTIRQYANEKLTQAGNSETLHDKHLEYFLNLAETADPHLRRAEQIEWSKRLDAEHDNLRAALAWAMNKSSAEPVLRLAGSLGIFWGMRSYWLEGAKWLDQALGRAWNENSIAEKTARAKALYRRHDSAEALDELDVMKTSAESALALYEELEDPWGVALTRALIANHQRHLRVFEASTIRTSLEQSLSELHSLGDAAAEARLLGWLAMLSLKTGTREEFLEFIQRALVRARDSGDRIQIALSLTGLAIGLMRHSQLEELETILQEAEQLYAEIDSPNVMEVHRLHAQFFFVDGNLEKAKVEAKRAIEYCERVGERSMQSNTFAVLALIAEIENDLQGAVAYVQKALELKREMGITSYVAFDFLLVGLFRYRQGNVEVGMQYIRDSLEFVRSGEVETVELLNIFDYLAGRFVEKKTQIAVQILALSESLARSSAVRRDPVFDKPYFDRYLATTRAKLSEAKFTSAWKAGSKMSLNGALDLVLKTMEEL